MDLDLSLVRLAWDRFKIQQLVPNYVWPAKLLPCFICQTRCTKASLASVIQEGSCNGYAADTSSIRFMRHPKWTTPRMQKSNKASDCHAPARYTYMQWDAAFAVDTAAMLIEARHHSWEKSVTGDTMD